MKHWKNICPRDKTATHRFCVNYHTKYIAELSNRRFKTYISESVYLLLSSNPLFGSDQYVTSLWRSVFSVVETVAYIVCRPPPPRLNNRRTLYNDYRSHSHLITETRNTAFCQNTLKGLATNFSLLYVCWAH